MYKKNEALCGVIEDYNSLNLVLEFVEAMILLLSIIKRMFFERFGFTSVGEFPGLFSFSGIFVKIRVVVCFGFFTI